MNKLQIVSLLLVFVFVLRAGGSRRGTYNRRGVRRWASRKPSVGQARSGLHVAAGYPELLAPGVPPPTLELWEREEALKLHNHYRRQLARGALSTSSRVGISGTQPQGAQRMYKLEWDVFLEDKARGIASNCQSLPPLEPNEHRNVYITKTHATRKDLLTEATHWWWREMRNLQLHNLSVSLPIPFNPPAGIKAATSGATNNVAFGYGFADPNTGRLFAGSGGSYGNGSNNSYNSGGGTGGAGQRGASPNWSNSRRKKRQTGSWANNTGFNNADTGNTGYGASTNSGTGNAGYGYNGGSNNLGTGNAGYGYAGGSNNSGTGNAGYGYNGASNNSGTGNAAYGYNGASNNMGPQQVFVGFGDGTMQNWKNMAASFSTRLGCAVNVCSYASNSSLNPFANLQRGNYNRYNSGNNQFSGNQQQQMTGQTTGGGGYSDGGGGGSSSANSQFNTRKKRQVGTRDGWRRGVGTGYSRTGTNLDQATKIVVCLYDNDLMNHPEPYVFTPGPACLQDAECTTYPTSKCQSGLCAGLHTLYRPTIDEALKRDILHEHNRLREYLAHGHVVTNAGNLLAAANMYKLEWSKDLEERAQRVSLSCQPNNFTFGSPNTNTDISQNVYVDVGLTHESDFRKRATILHKAIHTWWGELYRNGLPLQCVPGQELHCYANVRSFVNMAYFRATELGCAINHSCVNSSVVVCLYRKGGQDILNRKLYPQGQPCVHDQECTEYSNSWCETLTGLCVDVTKGKPQVNIPPLRNGLRLSIVDRQNSIRQRVVTRLAELPLGPCHPTGMSYYKLQWNSQLEARALQTASWCRSSRRVRYHYIGESFYTTHDQDVYGDDKKLLKHAFKRWLHESGANQRVNYGVAEKRDACTNYMNMLYGGAVNMACAVNHCSDDNTRKFSLVVCLFQRARTVADSDQEVPFHRACRSVSDCRSYANSTCEANTGLCQLSVPAAMANDLFLNNATFPNNTPNGGGGQMSVGGVATGSYNFPQPINVTNAFNAIQNGSSNSTINSGYGNAAQSIGGASNGGNAQQNGASINGAGGADDNGLGDDGNDAGDADTT